MDPYPASCPTPPTDRRLPAPAPQERRSGCDRSAEDTPVGASGRRVGRATALAFVVVVGGLFLGVRTARQLRRLRERGLTVEPLEHDVLLAGTGRARHVVVLGDSAAAGHGVAHADEALARLVGRRLHEDDGRTTAIRSVAVDGATTGQVLADQVDAATDAAVVLLGVGVNDAVRPHHRIGEVTATLDRLLARLDRSVAPGARIVLITCPDLSVAPGLPAVLRPAVGWRCRRLARAQAVVAAGRGVTVLDVDRWRLGPDVFGPDGFHPSAVGQRRLADRIAAALGSSPRDDAGAAGTAAGSADGAAAAARRTPGRGAVRPW